MCYVTINLTSDMLVQLFKLTIIIYTKNKSSLWAYFHF
jgi:hypothetical protein